MIYRELADELLPLCSKGVYYRCQYVIQCTIRSGMMYTIFPV